jgi:miniconductance mechanosensitive channel
MLKPIHDFLLSIGLPEGQALLGIEALEIILVVGLAWIASPIVRRILLSITHRLSKTTTTDWDDILVEHRVFHRLSYLAPAAVVHVLAPYAFETPEMVAVSRRIVEAYALIVVLVAVNAVLNAANQIYQRFEISKRVPIVGYIQVIKIILAISVAILVISALIDQSPLVLFTGLGAMTAVILLIFKDTILGLVAGIQLVGNNMVRPGDWIEMPKFGADGDVLEITLNTVKVQNFDKTITTIPTYALISDSFKNWRGMSESDGRRIKRSISIDVSSVKFCTPEMVEKFRKFAVLSAYISRKEAELAAHNKARGLDDSVLVNGRRMTNLGTFRNYLVAYLRAHPSINQEMTFLVRQLQPTELGVALEIYIFSADKNWVNYEEIQADIFDHIFAALPYFELRPFQRPTGYDLQSISAAG